MKQINPVKVTTKAGKRVGKALSIFDKAAHELEVASAEHLAASDRFAADSEAIKQEAESTLHAEIQAASEAFYAARLDAFEKRDDKLDRALTLDLLAEASEEEAVNAQVQADNLRKLLTVA